MALILEDGTGLANAESYCSVAQAAAYHSARGRADDWDAVVDKEAALRLATDHMLQVYSGRWKGTRLNTTQALDWPRVGVRTLDAPTVDLPSNAIPPGVRNACAELALRSDAAALLQDTGRETLSESVGEVSVTYAEGKTRQTQYPVVDGWVRQYLAGGGVSSIPVSRA